GWALYQVGIGTVFGTVLRDHPVVAVACSIVVAIGLGLAVDRVIAAFQAAHRRSDAVRVERVQRDALAFDSIDSVGDDAGRTTTGGTMTSTPQPPFATDAAEILTALHEFFPKHFTPEIVPAAREPIPGVPTNLELAQEAHPGLKHREVTVPGYQGDEITLSIWEPADGVKSGAGIYYIHGGGMMIGDRFLGALEYTAWADALNAVVVSVEYRLAPEHAYPTQTEDSYAGLVWFAENAASLGVDAANIVVAGASAGGNLAAAVSLIARDRKGPAIKGQLLEYPMLDDTQSTPSQLGYRDVGLWSGTSNDSGWTSFLGPIAPGSDDVPAYAAPARATDLSGLPPAFIDVGEAELFRDEDVAYATRLWAAGVSAELHVTPGIWHAFESFAADHPTSEIIRKRRLGWLRGILAG
ncbi:MAG TPA: alpha/beta hydrolase, partial [Microbacteriaceae bacterium]|nr:alpha/beta hydrolase [Microbacteriaceae bacterium]